MMVIALAAAMTFVGCGNDNESSDSKENNEKKSEQNKEDSGKTIVFKDDSGRKVKVPEKPEKVVASGHLAQLFLYAIAPDTIITSAGDRTDAEKKYLPDKYLDLPVVGSFFGQNDLN